MIPNKKKQGIILILISGMGYGLLGIFGKYIFAQGVSSGPALAVRFILAALMIGLWVLLFKRDEIKRLSLGDVVTCVLLGVFGYAAFSSLYFLALEGLSASMTVLLLYTYPVMVTLLSYLLLKERLGPLQKVALPLSFLGTVLLISGEFNLSSKISFMYGLLCALFYASYIVASRMRLQKVDPLVSVALIQASAAVTLSLLHLRSIETLSYTIEQGFFYILGLALIVTILPMITFAEGIKYLKASEVSVLYTIEPLAAITFSFVLLGEQINGTQIVGGLLVLISLVLVSLKKSDEKLTSSNTSTT